MLERDIRGWSTQKLLSEFGAEGWLPWAAAVIQDELARRGRLPGRWCFSCDESGLTTVEGSCGRCGRALQPVSLGRTIIAERIATVLILAFPVVVIGSTIDWSKTDFSDTPIRFLALLLAFSVFAAYMMVPIAGHYFGYKSGVSFFRDYVPVAYPPGCRSTFSSRRLARELLLSLRVTLVGLGIMVALGGLMWAIK